MSLRDDVRKRAKNRCEYCKTDQLVSGAQMHIEHILPESKGGETNRSNLCLSCAWCNSFKYTKTEFTDPKTFKTTKLFNPRTDKWVEHFEWFDGGLIIRGLTAIGRVTVEALKMNNEYIVPARRLWIEAGWHPPKND